MTDNRYLHLIRQDCPVPPGTHVVVYCRDSGGEEQDRSVIQQVETAREYCQHHNLVLENIYKDEARVSSNTDKRDALQTMLFDLRNRFKHINDRYKREKVAQEQPFGIIFWKSNRLGRDSIEATNIKTDLRLRGISIIDLVTSANTGNAGIDALIEAFQSWQDEMLLDEIAQNCKRGLAQLVGMRDTDVEFLHYNPGWQSTGALLGLRPGPAPRGFKGEAIQIGVYKRKKGRNSGEARVVQRIVPDPEMWDRCRLAWEMRHNGATLGEIHEATRLFKNVNGYDTFFSNRIYTGDFEYGEMVYEDFVPAMVPKAWFEHEQKRRAERAKKREGKKLDPQLEPRRVGSAYLLSGLVFCAAKDGEEHPMHAESIPAKKGKRGKYSFFICTTAKNSRGHHCEMKRLSVRSLEQSVIGNLMAHILTAERLGPLAKDIAKSLSQRSADADVRISAIESQLDEVRKGLNNILDAIENMGYATHLQQRYDARRREEEELLSELAQLQTLRVKPKRIHFITDELLNQWISYLRMAIEDGERPLARRLLQQFVAKIVIKEKTGTLYYTFPFPDDSYMSSYRDLALMELNPNLFFPQTLPVRCSFSNN